MRIPLSTGIAIALLLQASLFFIPAIDGPLVTALDTELPLDLAFDDGAPNVEEILASMDGSFLENLGQLDNDEVRFYARGYPLSVGLTTWGALYTVREVEEPHRPEIALAEPAIIRTTSFDIRFVGCNDVEPVGVGRLGHSTNFFIGDDESRWVRGAGSFEEVVYEDLWDGIDLVYYFKDGMLKYDLVVDAGADPSEVVMSYEGLESIEVDRELGDLLVSTGLGTLRDLRPVLLDERDGKVLDLRADFLVMGRGSVGFDVPERPDQGTSFVIDPGLIWATYVGGSLDDSPKSIALDAAGDVYCVGYTYSQDFPITNGTLDQDLNGTRDAMLIKLDGKDSTLLMATYFGGSLNDSFQDICIAPDGDLIAVGYTSSEDIPVTEDALMDRLPGIMSVFLARMGPNCTDLEYGTYFGGSGRDYGVDVARLEDGTTYILGVTNSSDIPTDRWAFCCTRDGSRSDYDLLVMRLDPSLGNAMNCTLLGGSGDDGYNGYFYCDLTLDERGSVVVVGATWSEDFPTTNGALQPEHVGNEMGFIAKLDCNLSKLLASTYLGGSSDFDRVRSIDIASNGTIFVTGETRSVDFPLTPNAMSANLSLGRASATDAFLTILEGDLSSLVYSTYIGGWNADAGGSIALGPDETSVIILGVTKCDNLTVVPGAFDSLFRGAQDAFLWEIDIGTMNITYSTYIGGSSNDYYGSNTIVIDDEGVVYAIFDTISNDMFTTEGAWDRTYNGDDEIYILKLDPTPCGPPDPPYNFTVVAENEHEWPTGWMEPEFNGARILYIVDYYYNSSSDAWERQGVMPWLDYLHIFGKSGYVVPEGNWGILWRWRISLVNSAGESELSNIAEAIWVIPPSTPVGLNVTADLSNGTVLLEWLPPEAPGTVSELNYTIYRGFSGSGLMELARVGNNTTYVDMNVVTGQSYYYAISASNERGEGPMTSPVCVIPKRPPSAPRSFELIPGDERVDLSWTSPLDDGGSMLLGYRLYRGTSPDDTILIEELPRTAISYLDTGLINGMVYFYYLVAFTEVGEGSATGMLNAMPFTVPSAPRELSVEAFDGRVLLSWEPPDSNGGLPIKGYLVLYGPSSASLSNTLEVGNATSCTHTHLTNGETYCYSVLAFNDAGPGPGTKSISVVPMGMPSPPERFDVDVGLEGVSLSWSAPQDWGGAKSLTYHVLRGPSVDSLEPLAEVMNSLSYRDPTGLGGLRYYYAVRAENSVGCGNLTVVLDVVIIMPPSPVDDVITLAGNRWIRVSWSPPLSDGGAEVIEYVLFRGTIETSLQEVDSMGLALEYNDTDVNNGLTYYYSVCAINLMGPGEMLTIVNATPFAPPNCPLAFQARATENGIELTWQEPISAGNAPVTGYQVLRGTSEGALTQIADLGTVLSYTDLDVEEGKNYYYQVVSKSAMGPSPPTHFQKARIEDNDLMGIGATWTQVLLIFVLVFGVVLGYVVIGRRRSVIAVGEADDLGGIAPEETTSMVVPITSKEKAGRRQYLVEEVFAVHRDGRLITSCVREEHQGQDGQMMSGMLIAVQGIIQDGLQLGGTLEGIKYGENSILMATGQHVILASVIYGQPDDDLRSTLETTVRFIETTYAGVIEEWTGELEISSGIEDLVKPILNMTGGLTRDDVEGDTVPQVVSLLSAVDFFRGYVRLKVAAVNSTAETIVDAAIELRYDRDMLRLEWIEPGTLRLKGDRVLLGNVKPRERKTVAFMFDPQICQETDIFGTLTYYDSHGEFRSEEMKRRRAEMVCPVFTSVASANTAMLRRLVKEALHQSEHRVLVYPPTLTPYEVLRLGKEVLDMSDLQLVHQYVSEGPPLEMETWYYGVTRVKGYQMVMRLGVIERKRALELFVASSSMEPVTGLFAEFRRELERLYHEEYPKERGLTQSEDEEVRRSLATRNLLIDRESSGAESDEEG